MLETKDDVIDEVLSTLLQIVNTLDHLLQELDLLILVLFLDVILEADLVLRELRNQLSETRSGDSCKGIVVK